MNSVNIYEAKTNLSSLLVQVEQQNKPVVICRYGKPIAELSPYVKKQRSRINPSLKPLAINCDLTAPVSEDWLIE